jgi:hypothetical protein
VLFDFIYAHPSSKLPEKRFRGVSSTAVGYEFEKEKKREINRKERKVR